MYDCPQGVQQEAATGVARKRDNAAGPNAANPAATLPNVRREIGFI